jgi:general secretion pathway protein I
MKRANAFTLVEILVALALVAVALAAGMRALSQAADGAGTLKARTLALWVAQNRLAAAQIAPASIGRGASRGQAVQASMSFVWQSTTSATPNPAFRRLDIVVAEASRPDYALAKLTGYIAVDEQR